MSVPTRKEDDRNGCRYGILFEFRECLQSVHNGHHDVQYDKIRHLDINQIQRFLAIVRHDNVIVVLKHQLIKIDYSRIVINDQYFLFHCGVVSAQKQCQTVSL